MTIMRKKSKKKQIVAMTLALSVLSSSVGMCGASAAEALPDTDDSGLQVTVVPLADSNADNDTPADDTKTEKQPVAPIFRRIILPGGIFCLHLQA